MIWVLLGAIGLSVGAFGSLIGVAGGFLLVPILLFMYPHETPATITSITLTVAFFSAVSGSIAYGHLRRIDYRSGVIFSLAAVPGAVLGAAITGLLNRHLFQLIFGICLFLVAVYLLAKPERHQVSDVVKAGHTSRKIIDRHGREYNYSFHPAQGISIAFVIGFIGGLLGIGGGILHVPALTQILGFPAHIATATSQFVVAISTFSAITERIIAGIYVESLLRSIVLSAGAIIGAQVGARLSHNVSEKWIVRLLAIGLAVVAVRLLIAPF
jgi:uncharacterized protein